MRLLLTDASGLLGRRLAERLPWSRGPTRPRPFGAPCARRRSRARSRSSTSSPTCRTEVPQRPDQDAAALAAAWPPGRALAAGSGIGARPRLGRPTEPPTRRTA